MTPRDGQRRYIAVMPTGTEPVVESLEMLREQSAHRKTIFRTLEAEVPLLVGLVRLTMPTRSRTRTPRWCASVPRTRSCCCSPAASCTTTS